VKKFLTVNEVSDILSLNKQTIRYDIRNGSLAAKKDKHGKYLISSSFVRTLLKRDKDIHNKIMIERDDAIKHREAFNEADAQSFWFRQKMVIVSVIVLCFLTIIDIHYRANNVNIVKKEITNKLQDNTYGKLTYQTLPKKHKGYFNGR